MSGFDEDEVRQVARKYALRNAVEHGKAAPGAVIGKIMGERPELRPHAKAIPPLVSQVVQEVNALSESERETEWSEVKDQVNLPQKEEQKGPLKPLPNAEEGKVVMRFAPNPSGMPHMGHARGMVVNWTYREMYDGKLILRYDDTDTTVKPPIPEAYDQILDAFEWLCGKPDVVIRASERMDHYYEWARKAIEAGGAYVCECEAETFRELKNRGEACPHRDASIEETLQSWDRMVAGGYDRGAAVLRVKTDIQHKDPALRDWVGFRIATEPHPLVGDRYKCWPVLDFQSAVDDHLEGVTHIIRGKDLMDSTRKQKFLYDHLGWDYPETLYWGRVSIHEFGKFSKSRLLEAIEKGEFEGWDDPRLPTLVALRRRGFQPEALRNFWLSFGLNQKDIAASAVNLEAENKKILEPRSNRYFWVANPRQVLVQGVGELTAHAPLHPEHPDRGTRTHHVRACPHGHPVLVADTDADELRAGVKVRLKDLANVEIVECTGPQVTENHPDAFCAQYVGNDLDFIKQPDVDIIHWAPIDGVKATVKMPDASDVDGIAERQLLDLDEGTVIQLERVGFARIDHKDDHEIQLYYTHG